MCLNLIMFATCIAHKISRNPWAWRIVICFGVLSENEIGSAGDLVVAEKGDIPHTRSSDPRQVIVHALIISFRRGQHLMSVPQYMTTLMEFLVPARNGLLGALTLLYGSQ